MTVLLDSRPVADAVIAAVGTALGEGRSYDVATLPGGNRVEGDLPKMFALTSVERRFDQSAERIGSGQYATAWRITVGCGGTTVREAAWALGKVTAALEDVWLMADAHEFICRFESSRPPAWDDGRYFGSVTFTAAT